MSDVTLRLWDRVSRGFAKTWNKDHSIQTFASAQESGAVSPHDDTELNYNALYIGSGGDVVIKHTASGTAVTYNNIPSGYLLPVAGVRVMAATTATNIVWMMW